MKKIFELVQNLQNLNRIKRTAGNLFMGVPENLNSSVAGYSWMVTNLSMLIGDHLVQKEKLDINTEKVLRYCVTNEWPNIVLGDVPYGSPSFASFWDIDIRKESGVAKKKIKEAMKELVEDEVVMNEIVLSEIEKEVVLVAGNTSMLLEMLEWRYAGFKHDGFEMVWFNTIDRMKKIKLKIANDLANLLNQAYEKGSKKYNIFLAKPELQVNPEHKLN